MAEAESSRTAVCSPGQEEQRALPVDEHRVTELRMPHSQRYNSELSRGPVWTSADGCPLMSWRATLCVRGRQVHGSAGVLSTAGGDHTIL